MVKIISTIRIYSKNLGAAYEKEEAPSLLYKSI